MPACALAALLAATLGAAPPPASAPRAPAKEKRAPSAAPSVLRGLDAALEEVIAKVAPAVVQVLVTGYGATEGEDGAGALIFRQHAVGSGVIVDPSGFIVTNAHVVGGAQRVRVLLPPGEGGGPGHRARRIHDARVVGAEADIDLALLKIDAKDLPSLPIGKREVRPGQLVFAIGSPQGLASTVTMGVVSSVARQPLPDRPMLYIQTDAPINPGNSGGPLVDTEGNVVGINAFILSRSGGSEGLGFAIPASVVQFVYDALRRSGHLHRTVIGAAAQEITPGLAAGLGLPQDWGVVVADVAPQGPAQAAGLAPGDVILSIDGRPVEAMPSLAAALYLHPAGTLLEVVVRRGAETRTLRVRGTEPDPSPERLAALSDVPRSAIPRLGIMAMELNARSAPLLPEAREPSGVIVTARTLDAAQLEVPLEPGDVIHAVNRTPVRTLAELRAALDAVRADAPLVLRVERRAQLTWMELDLQ